MLALPVKVNIDDIICLILHYYIKQYNDECFRHSLFSLPLLGANFHILGFIDEVYIAKTIC